MLAVAPAVNAKAGSIAAAADSDTIALLTRVRELHDTSSGWLTAGFVDDAAIVGNYLPVAVHA